MDRQEGMELLKTNGWLSAAPAEFQQAILSRSDWRRFDAGAPIQAGGEDDGELIGLARGVIAIRTILGRADTPLMHLAHPVFWFGYVPILTGRPRRLVADARTPVWLAQVPQAAVKALLVERPEWWRHLMQLSIIYGDVSQTVAADLLIRDSERRCAAVLLRLGAVRFASSRDSEPVDVLVTQHDLAGAANLSRNSAGAMVQRLKARGLIAPGYRGMTIGAPAALRAFVDEE
ncbi:CRP-like cAMP-binding protein [Roseiarcus fermentans]|uniref:CRP-like cAMP-binding protein n=1 Tax=Roseiarcus fermentans TaxID=1473586 RepID=A0A366F382_9HYPH|nr:Crp/Fnr family transcriptional regulator [Roseiarcus fermentans]RBP08175.1 CRP-like cAMP-binding protein [Roseiarcus fermentans]